MAEQYQIFVSDGDTIFEFTGKLDLISSFSHSLSSKMTDVAVEDGFVISDHSQIQPVTIQLEAVVTNLYDNTRTRQATEALFSAVGQATGLEGDVLLQQTENLLESIPTQRERRPEIVMRELVDLKDKRRILTIHSMLNSYDNMMVTSISAKEDVSTGDALHVRIGLKQLRIARTEKYRKFVRIDQDVLYAPVGPDRDEFQPYVDALSEPVAPVRTTPVAIQSGPLLNFGGGQAGYYY